MRSIWSWRQNRRRLRSEDSGALSKNRHHQYVRAFNISYLRRPLEGEAVITLSKLRAISEEVARLVSSGASPAEIDGAITEILTRDLPRELTEDQLKEIARQRSRVLARATGYGKSDPDATAAAQALLGDQYAKTRSGVAASVTSTVRRSVARGEAPQRVARRVESILKIARNHADTIVRTASIATARTATLSRALEDGVRFFRYSGPTANQRPWCAERTGRVFSIDEIRAMDNGQGLPPEQYCGGWNCRHRWVPWPGKIVEGNIKLHRSAEAAYEAANAGKKTQAAEFMQKELEALRVLAAIPKEFDVEINHLVRTNPGGDADSIVNGKVTDIKTTNTIRSALNNFMKGGKPQAEALVIDSEGEFRDFEEQLMRERVEIGKVEFIVIVDSKKNIVRYKKGRL